LSEHGRSEIARLVAAYASIVDPSRGHDAGSTRGAQIREAVRGRFKRAA
jgi:hypothetical protein